MVKRFWASPETRLSALCVGLLFLVSLVYFAPLLGGKVLPQQDVVRAKAMQQDVNEYRAAYGAEPYWSDSMFGGMPSYTFSALYPTNWLRHLGTLLFLGLPYPIGFFFWGMAFTFGLARTYGAHPLAALAGALGYGLFGYLSLIIEAGHYNKALVLLASPGVLWGMALVFRRRWWLGGIVFLLALGINLYYNHTQMTYYLALAAGIWALFQLVEALLKKTLKDYALGAALLLALAGLALLTNAAPLKPLYDYSKFTIRGPTELTEAPANEKTGGLAREYAYAWSYSREEMLSVLIPNAVGGNSSGTSLGARSSRFAKALGSPQQFEQYRGIVYWGKQSFTAGPFYLGAVLLFAFALGGFLVKGPLKWALLTVFSLSLLLSLGQFAFSVLGSLVILALPLVYYLLRGRVPAARQPWLAVGVAVVGVGAVWLFEPNEGAYTLYDAFFDGLPLANKFRVPSSMLVIAAFVAPWLAALGLAGAVDTKTPLPERKRALLASAALTGGVCLLLAAFKGVFFDLTGPYDGQLPEQFRTAIRADRARLFTADALRSVAFVGLALGALWLYASGSVKQAWVSLGAVALLVLADGWVVNSRVLNRKSYARDEQYAANFQPRPADLAILPDTTYYRVYPQARGPLTDGFSPFFHNSVGGYNAAKLRRFQELADRYLQPGNEHPPVLNMLNAKYFIVREQLTDTARFVPLALPKGAEQLGERVYRNRAAYGPAWFVRKALVVEGPDQALAATGQHNLRYTAILEQSDAPQLPALPDTALDFARESVTLTAQSNTELTYTTRSPFARLLVLSEVYYPDGWTATLDGQPTPILRCNYLLRGVVVPAGEHTLTLHYAPQSVAKALALSRLGSLATLAVVLLFVGLALWQGRGKQASGQ